MTDPIEYSITLDVQKAHTQCFLNMVKGDTDSVIKAAFTNGRTPYDLTGKTVVFAAIKPDGTCLYENATITNGKAVYECDVQLCTVKGLVLAQFIIMEGTSIKKSPQFFVVVNANADTERALVEPSTSTVGALNNLYAYFQTMINSGAFNGVSCTHSWDGTTLTVTSASGTSSADLKGDTGDDGVSCTHTWDGTVLNVTSASGTSSADLKGDKGDIGPQGISGADADLRAYVNDNQWDEQWEVGTINTTTGQEDDTVTTKFRSKNFIPIIPGHQYRLVAPSAIVLYKYDATQTYLGNNTWSPGTRTFESNCYFAKIASSTSYGATYNGDISINHDASDTSYHKAAFTGRHVSKTAQQNSSELITSGGAYKIKEEAIALFNSPTTLYVAPSSSGSDSNVGDYDHPLATINHALELGAKKVMLFAGTFYQQIDLSKSKHNTVEILPVETEKRVVFKDPDYRITSTESAVSGYTGVYSASVQFNPTNHIWLFQDSANDTNTLISDAERHPLQRGYAYRCEDTIIKPCEATTLNDALIEISTSDGYKWFYDNGTLYFSRPRSVDSAHAISCGLGNTLFLNADRSKTIIMSGVIVKYMSVNLDNTSNSVVTNCRVYNAFNSGGFTWDDAINATFNNCEAAHTQSGVVGDGFNAHSTINASGNDYAYRTTATLIDCWAHDNNDDGYSDHERCEIDIHGGLFEYNGKAGVTPSYGSHCCCYNVISRKNYNGFYYTTDSSVEGQDGKYGQLLCVNCVAVDNTETNDSAGFRCGGSGNKLILVGCKSIRNKYGYRAVSGTTADLYDCSSLGNTTSEKSGAGTFNIYSCIPISAGE